MQHYLPITHILSRLISILMFVGTFLVFPETYTTDQSVKTLYVDHLQDDTLPGSLRWAVDQQGPRHIEFTVEGILELASDLIISHADLTIDGSSAPGVGVTIKNGGIVIADTENISISHLHIRPGDATDTTFYRNSTRNHGILILGSKHISIDHCSISWTRDTAIVIDNSDAIILSNSLISEPLYSESASGNCIDILNSNVSLFGNLFSSFYNAAPRIQGKQNTQQTHPCFTQIYNNLFVSYHDAPISITLSENQPLLTSIINNYFIATNIANECCEVSLEPSIGDVSKSRLFIAGNYSSRFSGEPKNPWRIVSRKDNTINTYPEVRAHNDPLINIAPADYFSSEATLQSIYETVGAIAQERDGIDRRIIQSIFATNNTLIQSQEEVGGYNEMHRIIEESRYQEEVIDFDRPTKEILDQLEAYAAHANRSLPAFKGAVGFGAYTQGGRDGKTLYVTTLEDNDEPGSLRWAIAQSYPRIIQFKVAGIISLNSDLIVDQPYITIDGSTAPGPVLIKDGTVKVRYTHDVILQHLRVRPGDEVALKKGRWENTDRTDIPYDAIDIKKCVYVIVDHCTAGWSSGDEALSVMASRKVTVSNCLIAEPLNNPDLHDGQKHGYGSLVSGDEISFVRCLFTGLIRRAPQLSGTEIAADQLRMEAINNLVSGYGPYATVVALSARVPVHAAIINNYYRNPIKNFPPEIYVSKGGSDDTFVKLSRIYIRGNRGPNRLLSKADEWDLVDTDSELDKYPEIRTNKPSFDLSKTNIKKAKNAKKKVFKKAGAILPERCPLDRRIINAVKKQKDHPINSQDDVGGYSPFQMAYGSEEATENDSKALTNNNYRDSMQTLSTPLSDTFFSSDAYSSVATDAPDVLDEALKLSSDNLTTPVEAVSEEEALLIDSSNTKESDTLSQNTIDNDNDVSLPEQEESTATLEEQQHDNITEERCCEEIESCIEIDNIDKEDDRVNNAEASDNEIVETTTEQLSEDSDASENSASIQQEESSKLLVTVEPLYQPSSNTNTLQKLPLC